MKKVQPKHRSKQLLEPFDLAPHLLQFADCMKSSGFTTLTIEGYFNAVAHFGTWLKINRLAPDSITTRVLQRFAEHRCVCSGSVRKSCLSKKYVRRVSRFVDYLREIKVIEEESPSSKIGPPCWDQKGFANWLTCDRGLVAISIKNYEHSLKQIFPSLGYDCHQYTAERIRKVVCNYSEHHGQVSSQHITTALRAYLKYLVSKGICQYSLIAAVPTIAHWRLSALPRYISVEDMEKIVQSCDIDQPVGMRDHAILLLIARLGLRASDIVHMLVSDIDWNGATVLLKGKTRKASRLPLPQDAGDAILRYLEQGRAQSTDSKSLFLCAAAPHRALRTSSTVSSIAKAAIVRSGIVSPPSHGAHMLRHTAATGWLRDGVTLDSVSTILRHRSTDMTMHYAKIDVNALLELAVEWPGGTS